MNAGATFGINGRFLTQPVTGVQRYARNVVEAMDRSLATARASAELLVPAGTADPHYAAISRRELGPLNGHAWEQLTLAMRWPDRLLSLCNTGPVAKADQIVCIHDANVFTAPESYGRAFRTFYGLLQPQLARRAARVATVSNASARQIARYLSLDSADIAVLPNGHEHALAWDPSLAELAPSVIEDGSHPRRFVLAIGSRARHKNMQLLVDIAPDLAAMGIDVVIAGGDAGIFAPETLKSAPNVTVIGRISDHDLAYLMDRALCLAFPSWTEGFGLPIVEAMARGCAVISSDRASMPEICGDAALMASPAEPAAWIRQVRTLAESAQLRDDMVGRGRERVRLFSWNTTANGYISLMQDPRRSMARRAEPASPLAEPRIAAVVATLGRPEVVSRTVRHLLATQALKPSTVIVSCADVSDAGDLADLAGVTILTGPTGLPRQRNTALDALPADTDIVAFFDDDFVADADWLAAAARTFHDEPTVVGFTGHVLADGIKGPGIGLRRGRADRRDGRSEERLDLDRALQPLRLQHGVPGQQHRRPALRRSACPLWMAGRPRLCRSAGPQGGTTGQVCRRAGCPYGRQGRPRARGTAWLFPGRKSRLHAAQGHDEHPSGCRSHLPQPCEQCRESALAGAIH